MVPGTPATDRVGSILNRAPVSNGFVSILMERIRRDPELIVRIYELEASSLATITGLAEERRTSLFQLLRRVFRFTHVPAWMGY